MKDFEPLYENSYFMSDYFTTDMLGFNCIDYIHRMYCKSQDILYISGIEKYVIEEGTECSTSSRLDKYIGHPYERIFNGCLNGKKIYPYCKNKEMTDDFIKLKAYSNLKPDIITITARYANPRAFKKYGRYNSKYLGIPNHYVSLTLHLQLENLKWFYPIFTEVAKSKDDIYDVAGRFLEDTLKTDNITKPNNAELLGVLSYINKRSKDSKYNHINLNTLEANTTNFFKLYKSLEILEKYGYIKKHIHVIYSEYKNYNCYNNVTKEPINLYSYCTTELGKKLLNDIKDKQK